MRARRSERDEKSGGMAAGFTAAAQNTIMSSRDSRDVSLLPLITKISTARSPRKKGYRARRKTACLVREAAAAVRKLLENLITIAAGVNSRAFFDDDRR